MLNLEQAVRQAAALRAAGRLAECEAACRRILASAPRFVAARYLLAMALKGQGRLPEALESLDRCLALDASNLAARNNRANILRDMGRFADALADFDAALAQYPGEVLLRLNRGALLLGNLQRPHAAAADFEAVLARDPGHAQARAALAQARDPGLLEHLGATLRSQRRFDEARAVLDGVIAAHPGRASSFNQRGALFLEANFLDEALADFDAALKLSPDDLEIRLNRAVVLGSLARHAEATLELDAILAADPANPQARGMMAGAVLHACDWKRRAECAAGLAEVADQLAVPPLILTGYSDDPALLLRNAAAFMARLTAGIAPLPPRGISPGRIRIAYLSADFRPHPIAYQIASVIERHDRTRFDIIGIALGSDAGTPIRARLEGAFDQFHDVTAMSDEAAARFLRERNIDIAVDLHGHTMGGRPGILARRPASVQATWLGYPGTTGAGFIDYVIGDPETTPLAHQPFFSERIAQLPVTYMPNDSSRAPAGPPPSRADAGLPEQGFVFCCFNNHWKITPAMFDAWMRLLRDVPGSVLWLRRDNDATAEALRGEAAPRGIDPQRLVFAPRTESLADHVARLALADLFLDTVPYNAHATACDALWAGVPVLTLRSAAFAGRVGAGLLNALALPELITDDLQTYEAMARGLARDPARLEALRQKLNQNRTTQPLFDSAAFTRDLEAVFTAIVERVRAGEVPRAFQVQR